jgi:hypothetical protein
MKSILFLILGLTSVTTSAFAAEPRKASLAKVAVFTKLFNEADANGDGYLYREEFSNSYGASERPVVTSIRFNALANVFIGLPVIGLEDFIEANGGRKISPSKSQIFSYADDDEDGFLSMSEFFQTRIQSASSEASAARAFDKLDKNNDNQISEAEFGISIVPV